MHFLLGKCARQPNPFVSSISAFNVMGFGLFLRFLYPIMTFVSFCIIGHSLGTISSRAIFIRYLSSAVIAFTGHISTQIKHPLQKERSTSAFLFLSNSMHPSGQFSMHWPQLMHFSLSIAGLRAAPPVLFCRDVPGSEYGIFIQTTQKPLKLDSFHSMPALHSRSSPLSHPGSGEESLSSTNLSTQLQLFSKEPRG